MFGAETFQLWPSVAAPLSAAEYETLWPRVRPAFLARMAAHRIPEEMASQLAGIYLPLAAWAKGRHRPGQVLTLGINGSQGSGKSTLCDFLQLLMEEAYGFRIAGFSIDDIYKTRAERERMSHEVHPLFLTRGVPGTHDVGLGLQVLQDLKTAGPETQTRIPAFDKARDDRKSESEWPVFNGRPDVIIFEGWCVGSHPESEEALTSAINALEASEDEAGTWRRRVNEELKAGYARLFAELDHLIMLRVPGMESVFEWRSLQERKLAESAGAQGAHRVMDENALRRFIMHYERLTRHNLEEMPARADLVLSLDENHRFTRIAIKP